ncbi:MAG: DUF1499 domain-containing protein [Spirochaetaceae bacterium]|nr:DUF1499 domain-containing protein [Spirochaetaceae bacterium]
MKRYVCVFITIVLAGIFIGCAGTPVPKEVGLRPDGSIPEPASPPSSPNGVSSYVDTAVDGEHGAEPIPRGVKSAEAAQRDIREILESEERTEILADVPGYIHSVQYTALWKFPDDVEFWFPEDEPVIHFRSAARLGYGDMGVNRDRMNRIAEAYRR